MKEKRKRGLWSEEGKEEKRTTSGRRKGRRKKIPVDFFNPLYFLTNRNSIVNRIS